MRPFALSNNGRKVWATVLFPTKIMHRKVIQVNNFSFFLAISAGLQTVQIQKLLIPWQLEKTNSSLSLLSRAVIIILLSWPWFSVQSNLHVQPPLISDHLPQATAYPKHQNFPSKSVTVGTSSKQPPPVSNRGHFLSLKV